MQDDSKDFWDAIRRANSWGGDSDTVVAIVGSLAEANWSVPDDIKTFAFNFLPNKMQGFVNEFQLRFVHYERMPTFVPSKSFLWQR